VNRDINEASPKKRLSGTHNNFKVEWLKDPDIKDWLQRTVGMKILVIANAVRSAKKCKQFHVTAT